MEKTTLYENITHVPESDAGSDENGLPVFAQVTICLQVLLMVFIISGNALVLAVICRFHVLQVSRRPRVYLQNQFHKYFLNSLN